MRFSELRYNITEIFPEIKIFTKKYGHFTH